MNVLLQNLLHLFRRYRLSSWLNLLGLSLSFAVLYVVGRQGWYEYRFDKHYPEYELIYRVERDTTPIYGNERENYTRPHLAKKLAASPHIRQAGMCYMYVSKVDIYTSEESEEVYSGTLQRIDQGYTDLFGFEWVSGDVTGFDRSDRNIVIPAGMAEKMFGTIDVAGRQVRVTSLWDDEENPYYTIVAVYRDFPDNSTVFNGIYRSLADWRVDVTSNAGFKGYVKLDARENRNLVEEAMKKTEGLVVQFDGRYGEPEAVRLFPMADLYFHTTSPVERDLGTMGKRGNRQHWALLISFALLIMLVALINFSNFALSMAPGRIKSFNIQKIFGASVPLLRAQYIIECMFLSFLAFLLSLFLVWFMDESDFTRLFVTDIHLWKAPGMLLFCAFSSLLVGFGVALYPSFYMTSIPPDLALKGSFRLSPQGKSFSNLLIAFQFAIAFFFFIGSVFIYLQNDYMLHSPLGFEKEGVVVFQYRSKNMTEEQWAGFEDNLRNDPRAESVFALDNLPLNKSETFQGWNDPEKLEQLMKVLSVTPDAISGLGIRVTEGRLFRPDEVKGQVMVSESGRKKYGLKLGDTWSGCEIVGFFDDIKVFSFYKKNDVPIAILTDTERKFKLCMKLKPGIDEKEVMADKQNMLGDLAEVTTLEKVAEEFYEKDLNRMTLFSLLCAINIFIALLGVFGLLVFELRNRRKEIAIRKINGATVGAIIQLFSQRYLVIISLAFVGATPVAWYFVQRELERYVFHIPMYGWVFVFSYLLLLLLTLLTIGLYCRHVARENPVNSLKMDE